MYHTLVKILSGMLLGVLFSCPTLAWAETVELSLKARFLSGKAQVTKESRKQLDQIYRMVKDFSSADILVVGHSDSRGNETTNKFLSQQRARYISDYLMSKGIPATQITSHGVGSKEPVADNFTEWGRAQNRRVDIRFANLHHSQAAALREAIGVMPDVARLKETRSEIRHIAQAQNSTPAAVIPDSQPLIEEPVGEIMVKSVNESMPEPTTKPSAVSEEVNMVGANQKPLVPVQLPIKEEAVTNMSRHVFAVGTYYNTLNVKNIYGTGSADWVSKANINLGFDVQFNISDWLGVENGKTWLGIKFYGHRQDYEEAQNASYHWDGDVPFLSRGSIIFDYETERWGLGFDFDVNQEAFLYEEAFALKLVDEIMFGSTARLKYKLFDDGQISSRLGVDISYAFAGTGDIDAEGRLGFVGYLDLRSKQTFLQHDLGVKFYYGNRNFTNEQNDQDEEIIGLMFSLYSPEWL